MCTEMVAEHRTTGEGCNNFLFRLSFDFAQILEKFQYLETCPEKVRSMRDVFSRLVYLTVLAAGVFPVL